MTSKQKSLWGVLGIAIVVAAGIYFFRGDSKPHDEFREYTVQKGDLNITILATGTVQPENRLGIKPPIAGRIDDVLVVEGQKVRKGQMLAWMSSTERATLMDAASAKGPDEYAKWSELYKPTPVLAPISGTIILRSVEPGQVFASTDTILTMSDRLTVKAQVDETDIAQIKLKQDAEIVLDAYSDQKIAAKVDQIAYDATTTNNVTTYIVDVLPIKTPEYMRSGMTANVTFAIRSKKDVLLVPTDAIQLKTGSTSVTVKINEKEKAQREIEVGATDGKRTEVLSGLNAGDVVLITKINLQGKKNTATSPFGGPPRPPAQGGRK
jgi:macrolide-specific efflux system membrane fusion protein